jgi:NAD(P)-dependent dehydrogenase (short-subunit alcohol dehydrogenase family)
VDLEAFVGKPARSASPCQEWPAAVELTAAVNPHDDVARTCIARANNGWPHGAAEPLAFVLCYAEMASVSPSDHAHGPPETDVDYRQLLDLSGRVFVVLGAGQGIGRESARAVAQCGAVAVCVDIDGGLAQRVASEVGGSAETADVRRSEDVQNLFERVAARHGAVHDVIDIIGMAHSGQLLELDEAGWDAQFDIVVRHAFHALRYATPHIVAAGGGSIAFVGSISGLVGIPGQVAYGAAKAALLHLVRAAAMELSPLGVRVNAVAPGFTTTPRLQERLPASLWEAVAAATPDRRVGRPSDVAASLLFLSSPLAAHITGQILAVDGGTSVMVGMPSLDQLLSG